MPVESISEVYHHETVESLRTSRGRARSQQQAPALLQSSRTVVVGERLSGNPRASQAGDHRGSPGSPRPAGGVPAGRHPDLVSGPGAPGPADRRGHRPATRTGHLQSRHRIAGTDAQGRTRGYSVARGLHPGVDFKQAMLSHPLVYDRQAIPALLDIVRTSAVGVHRLPSSASSKASCLRSAGIRPTA